ncbi:MAG: histidine kinase dimerization/phospho-acceptor domain-containing protein [Geminicoccaceae bacterium]
MVLARGKPQTNLLDMSFEEIEHELKTPLASIRSVSEIMRDYPDITEEERQRFLHVLLTENERLARTVERLLGSTALQNSLT